MALPCCNGADCLTDIGQDFLSGGVLGGMARKTGGFGILGK